MVWELTPSDDEPGYARKCLTGHNQAVRWTVGAFPRRCDRSAESGKICKIENFANSWRARSRLYQNEILQEIIDPLIPKDMFRLVCLVKLVFFAREGVAF